MSAVSVRKTLEHKSSEGYDLRLYIIRCAVIFALTAVSCAVDSGAVKIFAPLFNLS